MNKLHLLKKYILLYYRTGAESAVLQCQRGNCNNVISRITTGIYGKRFMPEYDAGGDTAAENPSLHVQ